MSVVVPVTTDEFLAEIKIAQRWTMEFIEGKLHLHVKEDGEWKFTFVPDLSGMGASDVKAFMKQVDKVANSPFAQSQRVA